MSDFLRSNQSQTLELVGDLQSPSFLPWVIRHSQRLGLTCEVLHSDDGKAVFKVDGQVDLIDAFEVGCLLGPFDVWVETIERRPLTPNK